MPPFPPPASGGHRDPPSRHGPGMTAVARSMLPSASASAACNTNGNGPASAEAAEGEGEGGPLQWRGHQPAAASASSSWGGGNTNDGRRRQTSRASNDNNGWEGPSASTCNRRRQPSSYQPQRPQEPSYRRRNGGGGFHDNASSFSGGTTNNNRHNSQRRLQQQQQQQSHNSHPQQYQGGSTTVGPSNQYAAMYTPQKTQKRKRWHDGRLTLRGRMLSLCEAHPAPGSSGASLGCCELTRAQLAVLRSGGDVGTVEFESHLCTIEGPWVDNGGGGDGGVGVGVGMGIGGASTKKQQQQQQPSAGMKKLLSKKFVKPARVVPSQQPRYQQQQMQQQQRRWPGGNMTNYHGGGAPPPYGSGGGAQYARGGPPPPMHHHHHQQQQQQQQQQGQYGGGGNGGPDMRMRQTPAMNNNGQERPLPRRNQHQRPIPSMGGPSQPQHQRPFEERAPPPSPPQAPSGPMDDNEGPKTWQSEGPPQSQPPRSAHNNAGATQGDDSAGMGPASWQEGFGTSSTQQNPTAAAAPSSSFAGNDFEANQFYGEEDDEEPMGVGALSALLGGATDRSARPEQEVGQNLQNMQGHQPPSQARPTNSAPPSAPADNGSDSLSRSDLMRMICGDSFGGEEDSASNATNRSNDGNKRRKVEAPPDPSLKTPSLPANGHGTSNNGSDKGAEKSNDLFNVSLPSDDSDSDDSD